MDLSRIVCHRGYHDPELLDDSRPVENTVNAYERAWKNFDLCECDITCTTDGVIVLCHDDTFQRVAGDVSLLLAAQLNPSIIPVCDLTIEQVEKIKLLDETKPSRLIEVLEKAKSFNHVPTRESTAALKKKLVIEIKRDKAAERVVRCLCDLLEARSDLVPHVAVIMSFDLAIMKAMSNWKKKNKSSLQFDEMKLMVLTEAPAHYVENNNNICADIRLSGFAAFARALVFDNGLDGIYLEYQDEMTELPFTLRESAFQSTIVELSEHCLVGVWNYYKEQPDGLKTLSTLTSVGVSFVNSDLPDDEILRLGILQKRYHPDSCLETLWMYCIFGR